MKDNQQVRVRKGIFIPMSLIFLAIIIVGLIAPKTFYDVENAIVNYAFTDFGWLFQISGNFFLFICLFFCFSKYGDIKFGGKDAKPELSVWNWFAISLCAGIATGVVFWGIAEPLYHFMDSGVFETLGITAKTEEAAMFSMVTTYVHWTFIPYAMYAICGLGIAYAAYNMNLPYRVSSTLYPHSGQEDRGSGRRRRGRPVPSRNSRWRGGGSRSGNHADIQRYPDNDRDPRRQDYVGLGGRSGP